MKNGCNFARSKEDGYPQPLTKYFIMELNKTFNDGLWSKEINVRDFVSNNITPYYGDSSFLQGPPNVQKRCGTAVLKHSKKKGQITVYDHSTTKPYQQ